MNDVNEAAESEPKHHSSGSALNCLVMRMAQNRINLRKLTKEIERISYDSQWNQKTNLTKYRDYWYGDGERNWEGWVKAVNEPCNLDFDAEKPTADELELARMLDKKGEIRREYGKIKVALCTMGRKMLRDV